jgi:hypothetical protein
LRRAAISGKPGLPFLRDSLGEIAQGHPINRIDVLMPWRIVTTSQVRLDMKSFEPSLFADHFQFYIQDEAATRNLSRIWDEEATARMLAIAPGTIGIGTARNMDVPVAVEIRDQEPGDDVPNGTTLLKQLWM